MTAPSPTARRRLPKTSKLPGLSWVFSWDARMCLRRRHTHRRKHLQLSCLALTTPRMRMRRDKQQLHKAVKASKKQSKRTRGPAPDAFEGAHDDRYHVVCQMAGRALRSLSCGHVRCMQLHRVPSDWLNLCCRCIALLFAYEHETHIFRKSGDFIPVGRLLTAAACGFCRAAGGSDGAGRGPPL